MKNLINLKCPNCSANLSVEEGREFLFCEYCGAKLILNNENEYIYRHIDDADIKRAETEQLIKLKKLEMDEKRHEENKKITKIMAIITVIGVLICIISYIIASNSLNEDHWGYMVCLLLGACIGWMWIGKLLFDSNKK